MTPLDLTDIRQRMAHEPDAAIMQLRRWVEKAPGYTLARMLLAEAYGAAGRKDEATAAWRDVKLLAPDSPLPSTALSDFGAMDQTETPAASEDGPADVSGHFPDPSKRAGDEEDLPAGKRRRRKKDEPPPRDFRELLESEGRKQSVAPDVRPDEPEAPGTRTNEPELHRPPDAEEPEPETSTDKFARQQPADEEAKLRPSKQSEGLSEYEDLDRLIEELESARIEPDVETPDIPGPSLDNDIDDMVSETLARIHEAQEQYAEAARIYVRLAAQEPDRAEEYKQKAAAMRERANQSGQ